jgi:hypothetical protein
LVGLADFIPTIEDVSVVVATILATVYATTKIQGRNDRIKVYRGFLQEIKQNMLLAEHNLKQVYGSARTLFFRDDFWNMSKASGYFLDLSSNLQTLIYEIYLKQDEINEDLDLVGKVTVLKPVQDKIVEELKPKSVEAERLLLKALD